MAKLKKLTKQHLVRDFMELEKRIGRQPTCLDFARECHSITHLVHFFGRPGWKCFMKAVGRKTCQKRIRITREMLVEHYKKVRAALGRVPTQAEYIEGFASIESVRNRFRHTGWKGLMVAAGEILPQKAILQRPASRSSIISSYKRIAKALGRPPLYHEYVQHGGYGIDHIRARFGMPGWRNLVSTFGVKLPRGRQKLNAKHLIRDFIALQKKLGRRPTLKEYLLNCHTPKVLDRAFRSPGFKNMLKKIGGKVMPKPKQDPQPLIDAYVEAYNHYGYYPSYAEYRKLHAHSLKRIVRVFGAPGWKNIRSAAIKKMKQSKSKLPVI